MTNSTNLFRLSQEVNALNKSKFSRENDERAYSISTKYVQLAEPDEYTLAIRLVLSLQQEEKLIGKYWYSNYMSQLELKTETDDIEKSSWDYHSYKQETSSFSFDRLNQKIARLDSDIYPGISALYNLVYKDRQIQRGGDLMRPVNIRAAFEACGGENWHELGVIMGLAEYLNCVTYTENIVIDNKNGKMADGEERKKWVIAIGLQSRQASSWLYSELFRLKPIFDLSDFDIEKLLILFQNLVLQTTQGQFIDNFEPKLILNIENIDLPEAEFVEIYFKRSFLMSGIFYGNLAQIGGIFARASPLKLQVLKEFGDTFATGLQAINDLADFVPRMLKAGTGTEKEYKDNDNCPDIRNQKMTLPIYYMLKNANHDDRDFILGLAGKSISLVDNLRLIKILFDTGAFQKCKA